MDDVVRIAVALDVLRRRHGGLDAEALAQVLGEVWPEVVVRQALEQGLGVGCSAAACVVANDVSDARRKEARMLLHKAQMSDLLMRS